MKFIIATVAALASTAIASPTNPSQCKPATYRCEPGKAAWDVCNTSGQWVVSILSSLVMTKLVVLTVV
jgi:hypothetical protein